MANTTMILALFFSYNRKQMRFVRIHYDLDMIDRKLKLTTKSANATMKMVATCIVYGAALPSISTLLWMIHFHNNNFSFQEDKINIIHYVCMSSMAWAQGVLLVHFNHITQGIAARFLNVTYKIEQVVVGNNSTSLMPYQILVSGSSLEGRTSAGRIKALIRDYWLQCDTVREVNAFYGDQLLAVVLTSFFSTLNSLSAFVIYFTEDNMTGTIVAAIWSFSHIAFLLLMAYLGTNVTVSADEMVRTVCRLINMEIDDELRDQLEEFLLQLSNHKVELSACGFFNINYQTLTSRLVVLVSGGPFVLKAFVYWTLGSDDPYPLLLERMEKAGIPFFRASHDIFPRLSTRLHSPQTMHFCFLAQTVDCDIERQSVVTGHTVTVTLCRSLYPTCETFGWLQLTSCYRQILEHVRVLRCLCYVLLTELQCSSFQWLGY
ncbi:gustatory receptor [Homalodisca vitripennis]|nr:gustatory receptor [Homalodisca vitripennis]